MLVGDYLFISGQVQLDGSGNTVGPGDAAAQTRQCFESSMNSEKRSRTVRKDSLDMYTIAPHLCVHGKGHADQPNREGNECGDGVS